MHRLQPAALCGHFAHTTSGQRQDPLRRGGRDALLRIHRHLLEGSTFRALNQAFEVIDVD